MKKPAKYGKLLVIAVNILLSCYVKGGDTLLVDFINLPFHIKTIASDSNGTIWMSGGNGLFHFKGKDFIQKEEDFSDHIISNKGKIVRIGEYTGPIDLKGHYPWYFFEHWKKFLPTNNPYITAAKDKHGRVWVGSGNNIFIFRIENRFTQILEEHSTRGMFIDDHGNFYVNTYQGVLYNGRITFEYPEFAEGNIEGIGEELFIAWDGIVKQNLLTGQRMSIQFDSIEQNGELVKSEAYKVAMLKDTLWVATSAGLGIVRNDSLLILSDSIYIEDIYFSEDTERFLLATYGDGILERIGDQLIPVNLPKYDYNQILYYHNKYYLPSRQGLIIWDGTDQYEIITQADGLSSSLTNAVIVDDFNFLWVSTNAGLNRINLQTGAINHYLTNVEFNKRSFLKHGEQLYFGSLTGIFKFNPELFLEDDLITSDEEKNPFLMYSVLFIASTLLTSIFFYIKYKEQTRRKRERIKMLENQLFLTQIENFIFQSDKHVSTNDVADFLGVSDRQLYRVFKKYGVTPGKFIRETKLKKANNLISKENGKDIKEVAESVGYTKSYFLKIYERRFNINQSSRIKTQKPLK